MDWDSLLSAIPMVLYLTLIIAVPIVFVMTLINLMMRAATYLKARAEAPDAHAHGPANRTAREILDERYARGEVSREEYE